MIDPSTLKVGQLILCKVEAKWGTTIDVYEFIISKINLMDESVFITAAKSNLIFKYYEAEISVKDILKVYTNLERELLDAY